MIPPDDAYFERFKRDAPFVAVIEYVDAGYTRVTGQRTFRSQKPFKAGAGATIQLQGMNLNLYGLSACPSKRDISVYVYSGPCDQAAPQYINTELSLSPMLLCRVFESQADKPLQDATCFTLYRVLDTEIIHNLEDAVLRVGAVMLTRDKEGRPLRPDLETSEQFAREKQTLLWNPSAAAALGIHQ
ncbi:hypothetical protein GCM10011491_41640 [Brucella endophytica]|uniref:Uncharacterized protein n=2 Tax=Brucella endophytica TaxID=1963359 RepID=A0A916SNX8_9HYPH|nr:hypothetical protein GCM10011491_41640 [Brucella endophytica]